MGIRHTFPIPIPLPIPMRLSIIIVSWNTKELLRECLLSALADAQDSALDAETWVVDNASSDGTPQMVRDEFPQVRLIASETNLGFAAGNNAALRALGFPDRLDSQPDAVLLLNPDTIIKPGALRAMVDFLLAEPKVGIVGANLQFGDGSFQHGAYGFPGLWQLAIELLPLPGRLYESRLNGRYPIEWYERGEPFPIDHPLGAAMMVRAEAIWQAGLLDETYKMYVEEVDWAWRIKQRGWAAYCVPSAHIVHFGGQSTGQIRTESFINLWQSRYHFYRIRYHGWRLALARKIVQWGMKRIARQTPALAEACHRVVAIWRDM